MANTIQTGESPSSSLVNMVKEDTARPVAIFERFLQGYAAEQIIGATNVFTLSQKPVAKLALPDYILDLSPEKASINRAEQLAFRTGALVGGAQDFATVLGTVFYLFKDRADPIYQTAVQVGLAKLVTNLITYANNKEYKSPREKGWLKTFLTP